MIEQLTAPGAELGRTGIAVLDGDRLVGFGWLRVSPPSSNWKAVQWAGVAPEYNRRGIGHRIIAHLESRAIAVRDADAPGMPVELKIWDLPVHKVPIYMAASGPKSAYNAGRWGDGWICSAKDLAKAELRDAFARGAHDAGKDPDKMPKYVEQFVVVNPHYTDYTANLWRFTVNPWQKLAYDPVPSSIRARAYAMFSRTKALAGLPIGKDPDKHIAALQASLDLGGTPFVHSAEPDQTYVMEWYAAHVLPHVHR